VSPPVRRLLTPAARIRIDASRLLDRAMSVHIEAGMILGVGPNYPNRAIHDRLERTLGRLRQVAAELEQIADELEPPEPVPAPPGYAFGERSDP